MSADQRAHKNTCVRQHDLHLPQSRLPNGSCRECDRIRGIEYRKRRKQKLELFALLQDVLAANAADQERLIPGSSR